MTETNNFIRACDVDPRRKGDHDAKRAGFGGSRPRPRGEVLRPTSVLKL